MFTTLLWGELMHKHKPPPAKVVFLYLPYVFKTPQKNNMLEIHRILTDMPVTGISDINGPQNIQYNGTRLIPVMCKNGKYD